MPIHSKIMVATVQSPASLAAIALGSNLGDSLATVEAAIQSLIHEPDLTLVSQSRWYRTLAVGPPQPDYINGCVLIRVGRSPQALLDLLLSIEQQFGRVRTQPWGPRTLDLDLLWYDDVVLETSALTLPHPHMTARAFVLVPLAELCPDWVHPISGLTIRQHLDQVDCFGVSLLGARF